MIMVSLMATTDGERSGLPQVGADRMLALRTHSRHNGDAPQLATLESLERFERL